MFRWEDVDPITIDGLEVKMYRPNYEAERTQKVPFEDKELDHYAHRYLGSELYMYKVMDTNFIRLMEERFDVSRVRDIYMPIKEVL